MEYNTRSHCPCFESGADGTKNHSEIVAEGYLSVTNEKFLICQNHLVQYQNNVHGITVKLLTKTKEN